MNQPPADEAPVRLRLVRRDQPEFQMVDLESLLAPDHPAGAVWAFTQGLDLSELLGAIRARAGEPSGSAADPKILVTPWLDATIDAVCGARELTWLCTAYVAYRWICGGVSMNNHTLADFRVAQVALLDRLLAQGMASLVSERLVTLERRDQDGVRIRASAGTNSYRRRPRLESLLAEAEPGPGRRSCTEIGGGTYERSNKRRGIHPSRHGRSWPGESRLIPTPMRPGRGLRHGATPIQPPSIASSR